ncbi:MAG: hypothetical protein MPJ24_08770 [Pirellulaceae bacterium]|nr:hypothetical protein [Pirellulaceae bacterium]
MELFAMIGLGLLVLTFLVVWAMGIRTLKWPDATLFPLVFLVGTLAMFLVAEAAKIQTDQIGKHDKLVQQISQLKNDVVKLRSGDPYNENAAKNEPSLKRENGILRRIAIERGRVWRECSALVSKRDQGISEITVDLPTSEDDVAETTSAVFVDNQRLFAFQEIAPEESQNGEPAKALPASYVGEFSVVRSTPGSVVLTPSTPLSEQQIALVNQGMTWSLYEIFPTDSHYIFNDGNRTEENLWGEFDEEQFDKYFSKEALGLSDEAFSQIAQEFKQDGKVAKANENPDNILVLVEFETSYQEEVDGSIDLTVGIPFDIEGRATLPHLAQNGPTEFKKGDTIFLPVEKADELIAAQICKKIDNYYKRPLRDYAYLYRELDLQTQLISDKKEQLTQKLDSLTNIIEKMKIQISSRENEKDKLLSDKQYYEKELAAFEGLLAEVKVQNAELLQELALLYNNNSYMAKQYAAMQRAQAKKIDEETDLIKE